MLFNVLFSFLFVNSILGHVPDYVPEEVKEMIVNLRSVCLPKTGVTEEEVDNYEISNNAPKMMCYMKCMMNEAKWMTPDGVIQVDYIVKTSHDDIKSIVDAAVGKCKDVPDGSHECDKAYNFHVCLQQADPVHYFLP